MSASPPHPSPSGKGSDAELARYQALSAQAVLGLAFGLLGALAVLDPLAWILPPVGLVLSLLALRRIARDAPTLGGRKLALTGLLLSILFSAAAPAEWFTYRWLVRREACQFADHWFEFLRDGQADKAYLLTLDPGFRPRMDDSLAWYFRDNPSSVSDVDRYRARPVVKKLLALGPRAEARYERTENQERHWDRDLVELVYTVDDTGPGARLPFSVFLQLQRLRFAGAGRAGWHLFRAGETAGEAVE
jgi:hypothetical protein